MARGSTLARFRRSAARRGARRRVRRRVGLHEAAIEGVEQGGALGRGASVRAGQVLRGRWLPIDVQAVADLQVLDVAEIGVEPCEGVVVRCARG